MSRRLLLSTKNIKKHLFATCCFVIFSKMCNFAAVLEDFAERTTTFMTLTDHFEPQPIQAILRGGFVISAEPLCRIANPLPSSSATALHIPLRSSRSSCIGRTSHTSVHTCAPRPVRSRSASNTRHRNPSNTSGECC